MDDVVMRYKPGIQNYIDGSHEVGMNIIKR